MEPASEQPALLLQLDPYFQLPQDLERQRVEWCPLGGCEVRTYKPVLLGEACLRPLAQLAPSTAG